MYTKQCFKHFLLVSLACIFAAAAHAIVPATSSSPVQVKSLSLSEQRFHYEMAKSALNNGEWDTFEQHYAMLGDYALVPYLDYAMLKYNLNTLEMDKLERFLQVHAGSFLEYRLREQLLYTLAVKKRWEDYLRYYDVAIESKELTCFWLYARLYEGDNTALHEVADIWQRGYSHPQACDPLFNRWRRAGGLTQDIAWARFHNAMQAGNYGLARYITRFLDDKHADYALLYQKVHGYPYTMRQTRLFSEQSLPMQQIISHGIKRYARKNSKDALRLWELYEAQQLFPTELSTDTKLYVATRLIRNKHMAEAEELMANSHELREKAVIEALVRESLKTQNWEKVLQWVAELDKADQSHDRWRYWRARALEALDRTDDEYGTADQLYLSLSKNRSFYGFLAADRAGVSYTLEYIPVEISQSTLLTVSNLPGLRRAKELWLKGDLKEAQAEWIFTIRELASDELVAAGELARQWGWYNKGIHAMIAGNLWDHLSIRFPLAYEEQVFAVAENTNVAPDFIYAVARQESAFAENARSSAGAMGLMQLMPATARSTAKRNGIKHSLQDLFDPLHNMELGSRYLNQLLEQYNGNRILAAAAYNAGPHRVNRWLGRNPQDVPFDVWIETIPFKETRGYVQNVLSFSVIYGYRLGKPRALVSELEANSLL